MATLCTNGKCRRVQDHATRTDEKAVRKGPGNWRHVWACIFCGMGQGIALRKGSKAWKRIRKAGKVCFKR